MTTFKLTPEEIEATGVCRPLYVKSFQEDEHPRDDTGRFAAAGSSADYPAHIAALKLPPAWKNVKYNPNPKGNLLAIGEDKAGRKQYVYSEKFKAQQADTKFARLDELFKKVGKIKAAVDTDKSEESAVLRLIMTTGIRPGSNGDTLAKVKAYGATTLEGRHVKVDGKGNVRLQFVGKKGVAVDISVADKRVASELKARKKGNKEKLFATDGGKVLSYTHKQDGGSFKTKDFRTLVGTQTAQKEVKKYDVPKTLTEYKKRIREVAKAVAAKLGNTPAVALAAYIHPAVFAAWRMAAETKTVDDGGLNFNCSFGIVDNKLPDWRRVNIHDEVDDDDISRASADVIGMLGFDPFEA